MKTLGQKCVSRIPRLKMKTSFFRLTVKIWSLNGVILRVTTKVTTETTSHREKSSALPHTSLRALRRNPNRREEENGEGATAWHGKDEEDHHHFNFTPTRKPGPTLDQETSWTPLSLFYLFFSASEIQTLIANTNC